jgi:hypothetical protein
VNVVTSEPPTGRVLGVHVAGSTAYLAFRAEGSLEDHHDLRRIEPSQYMGSAEALYDFCQRFQQLLRECQPSLVAFLHTRNYQPNSYADAFKRASIESAVMIATRAVNVSYTLVRQEDAGTELGLPGRFKASQLTDAAMKLVSTQPLYWRERSLAYAAAATATALDEA